MGGSVPGPAAPRHGRGRRAGRGWAKLGAAMTPEHETAADPAGEERLVFADFELRPATGELRRLGAPVAIQPQPLKVLTHLARRPGVLVTREELQRLLWGSNTLVDAEQGLNFCLAQLRAALEDQARAPRYVETLPRRGYRFRHPVEVRREALRPVERQPAPGAAAPSPVAAPALAPTPAEPGATAPSPAPAPAPAPAPRRPRRPWPWAVAAAALLVGLAAGQLRRADAARARAAALEAVQEARALRGEGDRDALKRRLALLERATLIAPGLAEAQAALAEAYLESAGGDLWSREAMEKARTHATLALELDPDSSSAEVTLGLVQLQRDWDWEAARRRLERARALDPASPAALNATAVYLASRGEPGAAVALLEPVVVTGGPGELAAELPWHLYLARQYQPAVARLRAQVAERPGDAWPRLQLVYCQVLLGQDEEAFAAAREFLEAMGAPRERRERLARLPAREALQEFFRGRAEGQAGQARAGFAVEPAEIAGLFELAGRRQDALEWLERGAQERSRWLLPLALADPRFDGLREEPRFRALRARLGSP